MKSDPEALELAGRYLDGLASAEEGAQLEALMLGDAQLRAEFLACARTDALLRTATATAGGGDPAKAVPQAAGRRLRWPGILRPLAAAAVLLLGGIWMMFHSPQSKSPPSAAVARFGVLDSCRWIDPGATAAPGDAIAAGQRIELSAGRAEVEFDSGARLTLFGPSIFEPRSRNGGFLTLGEVDVSARELGAKGFTLETPTSTFVDIGTAFSAGVSADGRSRLDVEEGIVDVVLGAPEKARRLGAGESLYVEPGERRIVTRIEAGDGTPAFRFPTIPPPSADDYADRSQGHASIRVTAGTLRRDGGRVGRVVDVLLDGAGQSKQDSPRESAYFYPEDRGAFVVDLGRAVAVRTVRSYSWHQHEAIPAHRERARQRFTLYGFAGDEAPDPGLPPEQAGWTRIARINTDESLHVRQRLDRPAQQVCAVSADAGDIGRFRYLLWEIRGGTFYGEIDVIAAP